MSISDNSIIEDVEFRCIDWTGKDYVIYHDPENRKGDCVVNLKGLMICPRDLFTDEEKSIATQKYFQRFVEVQNNIVENNNKSGFGVFINSVGMYDEEKKNNSDEGELGTSSRQSS